MLGLDEGAMHGFYVNKSVVAPLEEHYEREVCKQLVVLLLLMKSLPCSTTQALLISTVLLWPSGFDRC